MGCTICSRHPSTSLPLFCTTCARNALYEPRLESAQLLLQKEACKKEVEQALTLRAKDDAQRSGTGNTFQRIASNKGYSRIILEDIQARELKSKDQAEKILRSVGELQEQNKRLREDVLGRKKAIAERHTQLSTAQKILANEQAAAPEPIKKATAKVQAQWYSLHTFDVDSRIFLCKEAAILLGLKQRKRKKGSPGRDVYMIATVPIPDLRDLNTADPTVVNVATFRLAQLLHLVASYLSLRLPAELTPPSPTCPYPTLTFPQFSYVSRPSQSSKSSSMPSKKTTTTFLLPPHTPPPPKQPPISSRSKPHSLYLPSKLGDLAQEDPAACSSFLDAITLLAWDIAWLCRVQGFDVGTKNWEEICAMGRNLFTLLLAPPPTILPIPKASAAAAATAAAANPARTSTTPESSPHPPTLDASAPAQVRMGMYSHDSNWAFLGAAKGQEFQKSWKFAGPLRLVERMKAALANEREGAEWEVVGESELEGWREGELGDEGEEVVGGDTEAEERLHRKEEGDARDRRERNGKSNDPGERQGWMKVKS